MCQAKNPGPHDNVKVNYRWIKIVEIPNNKSQITNPYMKLKNEHQTSNIEHRMKDKKLSDGVMEKNKHCLWF